MNLQKKVEIRRKRRGFRVRNKFRGFDQKKLRVTVFRSLKHIYSQIIDDLGHKTILSASSIDQKNSGKSKKEIAKLVGQNLGDKAIEKGIKDVCFDRGIYNYHGRVASLAEGLRSKGISF